MNTHNQKLILNQLKLLWAILKVSKDENEYTVI